MRNLILAAVITIGMGAYALLIWRLVVSQRRIRVLERDKAARAMLKLLDKPSAPLCDYKCHGR